MSQVTTLIKAGEPGFIIDKAVPHLKVSEFFGNTIQGEGVYIGQPATFLRLSGCTLDCTFCDTKEVWKHGHKYSIDQLLDLMVFHGIPMKLRAGQHLVITGGSPLMQQKVLVLFIQEFIKKFSFKPFIEVENECVILPCKEMIDYVDCWNNSPKLANSGVLFRKRYNPIVVGVMSTMMQPSWFKFVISNKKDWDEIETHFLDTDIIFRDQIILMPEGITEEEIRAKRELVINLAILHNVRYSTREHIVVWGKTTGI